MKPSPCPICRKAVDWETNPNRPFCSSRCQVMDLGAWAAESYRLQGKPEDECGEGWSEETQ